MIAQATAPSVPGRTITCSSDASALGVRYGSTTTKYAPRSLRARATWVITLTWVETGLPPHMMIRSDFAISRGSVPLMSPNPASQPALTTVVQMFGSWRE